MTRGPTETLMDLKRIEELLALLGAHDVTEFQYKDGDVQLKMRLGPPPAIHAPLAALPAVHPHPAATAPTAPPREAAAAPLPVAAQKDANTVTVDSPMVGTFYRAPSPGAPPFV